MKSVMVTLSDGQFETLKRLVDEHNGTRAASGRPSSGPIPEGAITLTELIRIAIDEAYGTSHDDVKDTALSSSAPGGRREYSP
jgi:hypothetical protein